MPQAAREQAQRTWKNGRSFRERLHNTQWECFYSKTELGFCWIFIKMTTFPFRCTYFFYNILLKKAQNTGYIIILVLLTDFRPFAQDFFYKMFLILNFVSSIRKHSSICFEIFQARSFWCFLSLLQRSRVYYSLWILSDYS